MFSLVNKINSNQNCLYSKRKIFDNYTKKFSNFPNMFPIFFNTVILSNFRKTRTKDRIVSNRIVSYRIIFKNTEKETANQTVELISNKNKQSLSLFL
jgi:hypothetical protein